MRRNQDLTHVKPNDVLYLEPCGNLARFYKNRPKPVPVTVTSVKRKYLYVKLHDGSREEVAIERETGWSREDGYNGGWFAYPTRDAYEREQDLETMLREIRKLFQASPPDARLTYDVVRAIHEPLVAAGILPPLHDADEKKIL